MSRNIPGLMAVLLMNAVLRRWTTMRLEPGSTTRQRRKGLRTHHCNCRRENG